MATGHYVEPRVPGWARDTAFQGRLLHSAAYRSGRDFAGLRALVVGLGNSGAEIATDLVEQGASSVSVAVRTPPPIVTRELFGAMPVQLFGIALMPLRIPRVVDRVGAVLRKRAVGDLRPYGLQPAAWGPFTARRPAVIDVGFLDVLKAGRVTVRPAVERLTAAAPRSRTARARTSTSSCSRPGSAPGSSASSATYRESSEPTASRSPAPAARPRRRASTSSASTRPSAGTCSKRGASRSGSPGPSRGAQDVRRNVQRLKRTNATGVTARSDSAWASVSSSPAPSTSAASTAAFRATTTSPTRR